VVGLPDVLSPETQQRYISLFGGRLVQFYGQGSCKDISGRYTEWFCDSNVQAVLVRLDYYICGTAKTRDGIEGLSKAPLIMSLPDMDA
jgi:hypothetical protein